ncbi:MAG: hypothetical protein B6A08_00895 [Sorangiineae bacterium NIC37A_2]|nr:MAG: hypothetical protein B6A08_00895 [Sorangiineae bacterium NIC37A_2]
MPRMTAMSDSAMIPGERYRERPRVASFGELLWDLFPEGPKLGGAPANLAFHAQKLGAEALLITEVGRDELGERALFRLEEAGVKVLCAKKSQAPTGRVLVSMRNGEPSYEIASPAAWDEIQVSEEDKAAVLRADVLCFGTLAARAPTSRATLDALLSLAGSRTAPWSFLDLNLRAPYDDRTTIEFCLARARALKMNEAELEQLGRVFETSTPLDFLQSRFTPAFICVTRGPRGATLYDSEGALEVDAFPSRGNHPVGAGDAFSAGLVVALARGQDRKTALSIAAERAARVAELPGAMPHF